MHEHNIRGRYRSLISVNEISRRVRSNLGLTGDYSLKAKSARGALIFAAGAFSDRGFRFVRNVLLARVLAPSEFGLMAIVLVATTILESFTDVGVWQSIIQNKRGAEREYLNVAWWIQAVRGFGLSLLGVVCAPLVSAFYQKPELIDLLRVAFLSSLIRSLASPRLGVLRKQYEYVKVVLLSLGSGVIGTIVSIICGFLIRNVWALVIGTVAEAAAITLLSYIFVPFLPRLSIHKESLAELMKFARDIMGSTLFIIIAGQVDVLVLGKMVSDERLGLYSLAAQLACIPIVLFDRAINPVLLPAFSQKQDDKDSVCRAVLQISQILSVIVIPLAVFMGTCSRPILSLSYGPQYEAMAVPFAFLGASVFIRMQSAVFMQAFVGLGRPHLQRAFEALRAVITMCLIYPAVRFFGPAGAAAVAMLSSLFQFGLAIPSMKKLIGLRTRVYMRSWLLGLATSVIVLVPAGFLTFTSDHISPWFTVSVALVTFLVASLTGLLRLTAYNIP